MEPHIGRALYMIYSMRFINVLSKSPPIPAAGVVSILALAARLQLPRLPPAQCAGVSNNLRRRQATADRE